MKTIFQLQTEKKTLTALNQVKLLIKSPALISTQLHIVYQFIGLVYLKAELFIFLE